MCFTEQVAMLPFGYLQARGRVPQPSGTLSAHTHAGNKMHKDLHDWFSAPCFGEDSRDEQPWPADHLWQEFTWQQRPSGSQMKPAICQLRICSQPLHEKVKIKRERKKKKNTKEKKSKKGQRKNSTSCAADIYFSLQQQRAAILHAAHSPGLLQAHCDTLEVLSSPFSKKAAILFLGSNTFLCSTLPEAKGKRTNGGFRQ